MKKIALYNPFLDTLGGGEKHILSIIDVIIEEGYDLTIFWDKNISSEIFSRFYFKNIKKINWLPSIKNLDFFKKLKILKNFNLFFYVTDGSYFFSNAKKNYIFAMVPDKKIYNFHLLNKLKLWNYKFISNSPYTTEWLIKWKINPITITPYIEKQKLFNKKINKEKIILSVGRFFYHLHTKNQQKIIETFINLKKTSYFFKDYKLILAGGLKKEDINYFNKLKSMIKKIPSIILKPNITFEELNKIYQSSEYYWHFTGIGIDEKLEPEKVEHFGISPLEACASGCIVFCHNSGQPKKIIKSGENGFLFDNEKELIEKIKRIHIDKKIKSKIIKNAQKMIRKKFNYEIFKKKVLNSILK